MRLKSLEAIFLALNASGIEYLVVGGVAVMAHGHVRLTQDLDLVLNLASPRLIDALQALKSLGYRSRLPVDPIDFASAKNRAQWQAEKGMVVFNLFSDRHLDVPIDIFPGEPFDFAREYAKATRFRVSPEVETTVVSIGQLIEMKRHAGRPQDLIDVDKLGKIMALTHDNP